MVVRACRDVPSAAWAACRIFGASDPACLVVTARTAFDAVSVRFGAPRPGLARLPLVACVGQCGRSGASDDRLAGPSGAGVGSGVAAGVGRVRWRASAWVDRDECRATCRSWTGASGDRPGGAMAPPAGSDGSIVGRGGRLDRRAAARSWAVASTSVGSRRVVGLEMPGPRSGPARPARCPGLGGHLSRVRGKSSDPDAQGDRREDEIDDAEREHKPKSLGSRHVPAGLLPRGPIPARAAPSRDGSTATGSAERAGPAAGAWRARQASGEPGDSNGT